jgi:hypothetical protein
LKYLNLIIVYCLDAFPQTLTSEGKCVTLTTVSEQPDNEEDELMGF